MPNRFQIKRTTTTGLLPNVSNVANTSYIAAGELAINLTDRKLLSSNGSATFEIGANLATIVVGTAFTQTSGNANFDSGVLFVDGTNNRVGVNNTTPAHALSVSGTLFAGNTTINGDLAIGGVDAGPNFISFRGTTGDSPNSYNHTYIGERIHTASEASELFLFKGNDPLSSAGPDRVRIGASEFRVDTYTSVLSGTFETVASSANLTNRFIITNAGNVGIGTTSPVDLLTVNRSSGSGITSGISLTTVAGGVGDGSYIKWTGDVTNEKIARIDGVLEGTDVGSIRFNTGNGADGFAERMRIDASGNVGIGNSTPSSKLVVAGAVELGNTTVTGFANVSGIVSADYYTASNNGNGTNYRIGDDAWLGDINSADTVGLKGQQNASYGYIKFGAAPTSLGYNGTSLIYSSNVSFGNTSVNGAITATGDITAFFSDDRLKDRYSNIPNAVEKVQSLNGFYYEPNITAQDLGYQKEMHVGVSAQEVNAIMPEVVAPAPIDNKYMTVKYDRLIPLLIEAIKEQQIQIDELKAQLKKD